MKCARMVNDRMMNVALNEKLLEEVTCIKFLASQIAIGGGTCEQVEFMMNEVLTLSGAGYRALNMAEAIKN